MKVAFLIEHLDPRRGGMETSAGEFLTEIRALGIDAQAVTQSASPAFQAAPVHALGIRGHGRAGRYQAFVEDAHRFVSEGGWDIVHAITPCRRCDVYQPRAGTAREALARTVAARRSPCTRLLRRLGAALNSKQRLLTRLERDLLAHEPRPQVAALSNYMRRQLENAWRLPPGVVREIFNGVTVPLPSLEEREWTRARLRKEFALPAETPVAVFVGHNFRRKGLARLLEAMAQTNEWHLLVLGKDSPRFYQRCARRLGLGERVRFLGSRANVRDLYLAADACVLPTYYDPCSRTVLEALSLGLPCITTRYDGSAECIQNGREGFVVNSPEAVAEMAEALRRLASPATRAEMSAHALSLRPRLSMRRHAEEMASLYEERLTVRAKAPAPAHGRPT